MEGCVLVEIDATVGELAEGSLLLDLGGLDGILWREDVSMIFQAILHRLRDNADNGDHGEGIERRTYSSAMIAVV